MSSSVFALSITPPSLSLNIYPGETQYVIIKIVNDINNNQMVNLEAINNDSYMLCLFDNNNTTKVVALNPYQEDYEIVSFYVPSYVTIGNRYCNFTFTYVQPEGLQITSPEPQGSGGLAWTGYPPNVVKNKTLNDTMNIYQGLLNYYQNRVNNYTEKITTFPEQLINITYAYSNQNNRVTSGGLSGVSTVALPKDTLKNDNNIISLAIILSSILIAIMIKVVRSSNDTHTRQDKTKQDKRQS